RNGQSARPCIGMTGHPGGGQGALPAPSGVVRPKPLARVPRAQLAGAVTLTASFVVWPRSAVTVSSARAPWGARTGTVQVLGGARKRTPPSEPSGTSATNSPPSFSSRAYPTCTGAPPADTVPSMMASPEEFSVTATPPAGAPQPCGSPV